MSLTIESLSCWLVDIPTVRPHKLSMASMGCQTLTLVKMVCEDGVTGWGEATTRISPA
jgi:muconate cycloisomerase